jgi:hypothetical protein
MKELDKGNKFTKVSQVGIIVKDIRKTMAAMERVFGATPDKEGNVCPTNRRYHGKEGDFDALIALYDFANIQIELIEPLRGDNIWQEFLDKHGEGIHHIRFNVEDNDAAINDMAEKGIEVSQSGDSLTPGLRWTYFDSEDALGFIVEQFSSYGEKNKEP